MNAARQLGALAFASICLLASHAPGQSTAESESQQATFSERTRDADELLGLYEALADAVAHVELHYAERVDRQQLFESAIRGMLSELDPHSNYLSREEFQRYQERLRVGQTPGSAANRKPTVLGHARGEDGLWVHEVRRLPRVAYIGLTSFTSTTASELSAAIDRLEAPNALVLDLRFNAGGLLAASVDVADLFLDEGTIVATRGRSSDRREWNASAPSLFPKLPLVVLVNGRSASGAEVVASALQDNGRATVVGERTWGKGSVQNFFELAQGRAGLKLTTALYQRPSGANIHRRPGMTAADVWGVAPAQRWTLAVSGEEAQAVLSRRAKLAAGESPGAPVVDRQLDLAIDAAVHAVTLEAKSTIRRRSFRPR